MNEENNNPIVPNKNKGFFTDKAKVKNLYISFQVYKETLLENILSNL